MHRITGRIMRPLLISGGIPDCLAGYPVSPDTGSGKCLADAIPVIYLVFLRVVNPDPDWIRIQRLSGSGSILGIRIRIQGQEN
jgi:hypothetical protein